MARTPDGKIWLITSFKGCPAGSKESCPLRDSEISLLEGVPEQRGGRGKTTKKIVCTAEGCDGQVEYLEIGFWKF